MLPRGTLFPPIAPAEVRGIRLPVLIMTGGKSYDFLKLIDADLALLLPDHESRLYPNSGHQMWLQEPARCRADAQEFFHEHDH